MFQGVRQACSFKDFNFNRKEIYYICRCLAAEWRITMALRQIRKIGDEILGHQTREIKKMTPRISVLIEDMLDTMYEMQGVGLAAPQVGILKKVVVIDVSENGDEPLVLVNPEILEESGEQTGQEACLSVPGKVGVVTRSNYVKVKAFDEDMEEIIIEGEGLLARAIQHEVDHLSGVLYVSKIEGELMDAEQEN